MAVAGEPAEKAQDFTLKDTKGQEHTLSGYQGKFVVLEWTNYECPFVQKHYGAGNMQSLQKRYTAKDVIWLTICSSAPAKQGYNTPEKWNDLLAARGAAATALLIDDKGTVGRLYGAKTTPQMFVINPAGEIIYKGAIDDKPSFNPADIAGAKNYVRAALDAAMAGNAVETASSAPYGCSVKY